jgi:site-specific DNA-methyltransferase (adenine-specific)
MINLMHGDCLELMKTIPDNSIDMVLTDPPYGTTACKWDTVIPFAPMWEELNRIIKNNGAICLFGNEPFTSVLIGSNLKGFKYRWDWDKKIPSGMGYAKYRPMQQTEDISVFTKKGEKTYYFPLKTKRDIPISHGSKNSEFSGRVMSKSGTNSGSKRIKSCVHHFKNPTTLLKFDKIRRGSVHPTQKPVALLEYLIKTYTLEGETVLDFTAGSFSTGVACVNLDRSFIGIEQDENYYNIGVKRVNDAKIQRQNKS